MIPVYSNAIQAKEHAQANNTEIQASCLAASNKIGIIMTSFERPVLSMMMSAVCKSEIEAFIFLILPNNQSLLLTPLFCLIGKNLYKYLMYDLK
jgi:hypothetical protein